MESGYLFRLRARAGGNGGGNWDDNAELAGVGRRLGCGGMRLSSVQVQTWGHSADYRVFGRIRSTYRHHENENNEFLTGWRGRIHEPDDQGHNYQLQLITPGHRLHKVSCQNNASQMHMAGALCVKTLALTSHNLAGEPAASTQVAGPAAQHYGYSITLPRGITVAGLYGRSGDSVDAVGFYLCPDVPGAWSADIHRHLPPPFRAQARALVLVLHRLAGVADLHRLFVSSLFHTTFVHPDAGGRPENDTIAQWVMQQCGGITVQDAAA